MNFSGRPTREIQFQKCTKLLPFWELLLQHSYVLNLVSDDLYHFNCIFSDFVTIAEIFNTSCEHLKCSLCKHEKKTCFMSYVIIVRTLRIFVDDPCLILKFQNDTCEGI